MTCGVFRCRQLFMLFQTTRVLRDVAGGRRGGRGGLVGRGTVLDVSWQSFH